MQPDQQVIGWIPWGMMAYKSWTKIHEWTRTVERIWVIQKEI